MPHWSDNSIEGKIVLYMMGQHCMAHKMNLAIQVLSIVPMVAKLEDLLQSLYSYYSNSPKKHLEFTKLVEIVGIRRLKILRNVQIWWISMLEPLKQMMAKYKTLIMKMSQDNVSIVQAMFNLDLFNDLHMLGLFCLLPLLEAMNALIKFAQRRDIFICEVVVAIMIYQTNLYMMYSYPSNNY